MNKNLILFVAVAVLAVGVGVVGGKAILGTTQAASDGTCKVTQAVSNTPVQQQNVDKYFLVPESAIPSSDFEASVAKIKSGEDKNARLYVTSNGERFILNLEPGAADQDDQAKKLQEKADQIAKAHDDLEAQNGRSATAKGIAIQNINDFAGTADVKFLETIPSLNMERYADNKGFDYFVSKASNRIVAMSANKDFQSLNSSILDNNGWKASIITKEKAEEIARNFIREKSGLDQKAMDEVLSGLKASDGKHGAFRFSYGEDGSGVYGKGSWAVEIIIEPASGMVINYMNALVK